jgi:uncharacterized membrane protein YfcA
MDALSLLVLVGASLATSILSAIVGMAGGIVLLSIMLLFFDPLVAIPIHGAVQLVSNASRACIQRHHVEWGIVARYAAFLLPTGFIGLAVLRSLSPEVARALIGAFVLLATWAPRWLLLGTHPERIDRNRRFLVLGAVIGAVNVAIGATGPLLAPFFLNLGLTRQAIVGTKAACQVLGHVVKLLVFGLAGFAYAEYAGPLVLLAAAVVVGTWIGSRILGRVSEVAFTRLLRGVLTIVALRLLIGEGLAALGVY